MYKHLKQKQFFVKPYIIVAVVFYYVQKYNGHLVHIEWYVIDFYCVVCFLKN